MDSAWYLDYDCIRRLRDSSSVRCATTKYIACVSVCMCVYARTSLRPYLCVCVCVCVCVVCDV